MRASSRPPPDEPTTSDGALTSSALLAIRGRPGAGHPGGRLCPRVQGAGAPTRPRGPATGWARGDAPGSMRPPRRGRPRSDSFVSPGVTEHPSGSDRCHRCVYRSTCGCPIDRRERARRAPPRCDVASPMSVPWPHPEALGTPSRWRPRPPVQGERLARAPLHRSPREARPPAQRLNVRRHGVPVRKSWVKTRIATCPGSRAAASATRQAGSQLRHRIRPGLP